MQIIGVCGYIGSGKDTFANILIEEKKYVKLSFASALKDAVSNIFGWDREMLEGATPESRKWRECIDEWWSQRLNISGLTPRWILQHWGTDILRNQFHPDIWLASLERKLLSSSYDKVVITDCRFPNEIQVLKRLGAKMVRINRAEKSAISSHTSENSWEGTNFDFIIDNNYSLEDLRVKVLSIF